jgi:hypothetical protein
VLQRAIHIFLQASCTYYILQTDRNTTKKKKKVTRSDVSELYSELPNLIMTRTAVLAEVYSVFPNPQGKCLDSLKLHKAQVLPHNDQSCTPLSTQVDITSAALLNSVALVREHTIPTERPPFDGEVNDNFADSECRLVSSMDPHVRILGFLDRSSYYFVQVAPQLYSRG